MLIYLPNATLTSKRSRRRKGGGYWGVGRLSWTSRLMPDPGPGRRWRVGRWAVFTWRRDEKETPRWGRQRWESRQRWGGGAAGQSGGGEEMKEDADSREAACSVPCLAHSAPGCPDGRTLGPIGAGLVPGGKDRRTPGGGNVSHSAIWRWVTGFCSDWALDRRPSASGRLVYCCVSLPSWPFQRHI